MEKEFKESEIEEVAKEILLKIKKEKTVSSATVVALSGDLGAGKTTMTQALAKLLGLSDKISSPTFILMKNYELKNSAWEKLIHIDAYRIEKSRELLSLGWKNIISDPHNVVLIEWPERVIDILPEHIKINFSHTSDEGREIEIL